MKRPDRPSRRRVNALGKSEIVVTPTGLALVEQLAERGCSVVTISAALGVNKETFLHIRRRDQAVDDAFERGRAREHDRLVGNLTTAAESGNVVASIFLLKARHGYREGEPMEVNVEVNTGGVLVVPAEVTVEQIREMTRAAAEMTYVPPEPVPGAATPDSSAAAAAAVPGRAGERVAPAAPRQPSPQRTQPADVPRLR